MALPIKCLNDCSLIISTFEKSCAADITEESVFAPLMGALASMKTYSTITQQTLSGYLLTPTSNSTTEALQSILPDTVFNTLGDKVIDHIKDCIPCLDRMVSLSELFPSIDLLTVLQADLQAKLALLDNIIRMLANFSTYNDLCELLDLLSFMCIPDLQRLIAILSTLISFDIPQFSLNGDLILGLIVPIFTPLLTSMTGLLDRFALVVLSPLTCIIDHLNQTSRRLRGLQQEGSDNLASGIEQLTDNLIEGADKIEEKLGFYIEQLDSLVGEFNEKSQLYIDFGLKKLERVRLIFLIAAIINALSKGRLSCSRNNTNQGEMEAFINDFLNPNTSYTIRLDPQGELIIDERIIDMPDSTTKDAEPLITPEYATIQDQITNLSQSTVEQVNIKVPCKMRTQSGSSSKINQWVSSLSKKV
jgi:hypothetical protein